MFSKDIMDGKPPVLHQAPPLDPAWLTHEAEADLLSPKPFIDPVERQPIYAAQCRERNAAMLAQGMRDYHLSQGIKTRLLSVPAVKDNYAVPVLQYDRVPVTDSNAIDPGSDADVVIIYYHGGGLMVGEADSEDLSCRRIIKETASFLARPRLYSIGYRLRPQHPVTTCVSDATEAFTTLVRTHSSAKIMVVGSSSGGQLAALVAQHATQLGLPIHGVLLRCPVTSDAAFYPDSDEAHIPLGLRELHTSTRNPSFRTSLLAHLYTDPREGLEKMPLEAKVDELRGLPRTWVQLCTNDALYSDGACYVEALRDAGVEVKIDVVWGWPHTFWLKAPMLDRALHAERAMIEGLCWLAA